LRDLDEPRHLSGEERKQIFLLIPQPETEKILMLPISQKDEPTVGGALVSLPPDEPEDELPLVTFLLSQAAGAIRRAVLQEEELKALRQIVGVRELENVIEHAFILAKGERINLSGLPAYLQETGKVIQGSGESLEELERGHLLHVLEECQGNKNQAARRLKISRSTLYRKLERYGLLK
jgi:transcriptional regulator of acetoin/glycerol metabolism